MSDAYSLFAERRIIGAILRDPPKYWTVAKVVSSEMFWAPIHRDIFEDCRAQINETSSVSVGRIIEVARRRTGDEATAWAMEVQDEAVSSVSLSADADAVRKFWMARRALEICRDATETVDENPTDPTATISKAAATLAGLSRSTAVTESSDLELIDDVGGLLTAAGKPIRLPLGFGWLVQRRGELTILCGTPASGKSTLALQIADWYGEAIGRARMHSMEMKRRQVARRLMSKDLEFPAAELWGKAISENLQTWKDGRASRGIRLTIDDKSGIPVEELCGACMEQHTRQPLSIVVVDYLQLMTVGSSKKNASTADETAAKSHALKQLAMDLDIPVLCLAQFNREGKKKDRPSVYDLDGGGAIENDADQIWVLHREGVADGSPAMRLSIDKHREGPKGCVELYPEYEFFRFVDGADINALGPT